MILHLVRHPEPEIEPGRCYGRLDIAVRDPVTVAQALRGTLPQGLPVWSSPLRRCHVLARLLHAEPRLDARLAEMHFGDWEGLAWSAIPRIELDAWAADVTGYAPPGGESVASVQARALAFVGGLDVPEAIVVTHAGIIRVLRAASLGRPLASCLDDRVAYGEVVELRF